MLSKEQEFCLEGCRSFKQYFTMRQRFEGGICAFCELDTDLNQVVWGNGVTEQFRIWHVHESFMRSESLKSHILIVPKAHVRFLGDLPDHAGTSLIRAARFAKNHFGYEGGLLHAREGDMRFNAGTVPHLHFNIFEPSRKKELRVPVFKDSDDRQQNQKRAAGYAVRYESGETP